MPQHRDRLCQGDIYTLLKEKGYTPENLSGTTQHAVYVKGGVEEFPFQCGEPGVCRLSKPGGVTAAVEWNTNGVS